MPVKPSMISKIGLSLSEYTFKRFTSIKDRPKIKVGHIPKNIPRKKRDAFRERCIIDLQLAAWRDAERAAGRWPPRRS
jgi:hypothetical protein